MNEKEGMDGQRALGGRGKTQSLHASTTTTCKTLFSDMYVLIGPRHPLQISKCKYK
jgi:hypothetical protein